MEWSKQRVEQVKESQQHFLESQEIDYVAATLIVITF